MFNLMDLRGYKEFDVDSQIIYNHLDLENNLQDIWEAMGGQSNWKGAAALTWWDKRDSTLNIARNDQRKLFYCYKEKKKDNEIYSRTLYWASEPWMLDVALSRANIPHTEIKLFDENKHYKFNVTDPMLSFTITELHEPVNNRFQRRGRWSYDSYYYDVYGTGYGVVKGGKTEERKLLTPPPPLFKKPVKEKIVVKENVGKLQFTLTEYGSTLIKDEVRTFLTGWSLDKGYNIRIYIPRDTKDPKEVAKRFLKRNEVFACDYYGKNRTENQNYDFVTSSPKIYSVKYTDENKEEIEYYQGPNNTMLSKQEWDKLNWRGCSYCDKDLDKNYDFIHWFDKDTPLCQDCYGHHKVG